MDTPAETAGKYDSVVIYDHQGTPKAYAENMPIFVLLGQDKLAPKAVEAYADALAAEGMAEQAEEVRAFSLRMQTWQIENPDRVKLPD